MNAFCVEAKGSRGSWQRVLTNRDFNLRWGQKKLTRAIMNPSCMEAKGSRGSWQRVPQNQDFNLGWGQKKLDLCNNESILY